MKIAILQMTILSLISYSFCGENFKDSISFLDISVGSSWTICDSIDTTTIEVIKDTIINDIQCVKLGWKDIHSNNFYQYEYWYPENGFLYQIGRGFGKEVIVFNPALPFYCETKEKGFKWNVEVNLMGTKTKITHIIQEHKIAEFSNNEKYELLSILSYDNFKAYCRVYVKGKGLIQEKFGIVKNNQVKFSKTKNRIDLKNEQVKNAREEKAK